jgi:hypothetical protein
MAWRTMLPALILTAVASTAWAATDPAQTQTLFAPTAQVLAPRNVRLATTDVFLNRLEYGYTESTQLGFTFFGLGLSADGKYQYHATGPTHLAVMGLAGVSFDGSPTVVLAHVATYSPWIFQFNSLVGAGNYGDELEGVASLGAAVQFGGHVKLLTEVTASVDHFDLEDSPFIPDGFGMAGFRFFGDSLSADVGLALYADILRAGTDYFPAFPLVSLSYRAE